MQLRLTCFKFLLYSYHGYLRCFGVCERTKKALIFEHNVIDSTRLNLSALKFYFSNNIFYSCICSSPKCKFRDFKCEK